MSTDEPTETLTDLLIAIDDGDLNLAEDYLESLKSWLEKGGHKPHFEQAFNRFTMAG